MSLLSYKSLTSAHSFDTFIRNFKKSSFYNAGCFIDKPWSQGLRSWQDRLSNAVLKSALLHTWPIKNWHVCSYRKGCLYIKAETCSDCCSYLDFLVCWALVCWTVMKSFVVLSSNIFEYFYFWFNFIQISKVLKLL